VVTVPQTILVVDDDAGVRRLVELRFQLDDFEVVATGEPEEALRLASERHPDAVILDVMMHDMDGFEVCRRMREAQRGRGPIIVMLTAKAGTEAMLTGVTAGADDYVVKPPRLDDMVERVRSRLRQVTTEAGRLHALPNGAAIAAELERRRAEESDVAVACLDLNGFEGFNTRYGYERGDTVLEWFADLLVAEADRRSDGFVGRLGSDDFIVVSAPGDAEPMAEAILATFEAGIAGHHDPEDVARGAIGLPGEGQTPPRHPLVSLAIGITSSVLHPADYPQELLHAAVQMVRTAKLLAGSRLVVDRAA
jgi:PleD family two-component response regulator